jgi:TPR repeat protein
MKAPRYVGIFYQKGYGRNADYARAAQYYQIGADRGDIASQYLLGSLYERGFGVKQNYATAMKWYMKSAERGDIIAAPAMIAIGRLYERGLGVDKDIDTALQWYRKADKAGDNSARHTSMQLFRVQAFKVVYPRISLYVRLPIPVSRV